MAKKILILSSSLGGGHQSASVALEQIIKTKFPKIQIKIANMSPPLGSTVYRFLSNYLTEVFVKNWHIFNTESAAKLLQTLSAPLVMAKLAPLLKQFRPNLIIATHSFSTEAVDLTLKQTGLKIPLLVILVDPFSIHHAWTVYKQADLYLLPNRHSFQVFKKRGIDQHRLRITGQPIKPVPADIHRIDPKRLKQSLGLNPKILSFFLGGSGEGVGRLDQIVKLLLRQKNYQERFQLIIACGKNKLLFAQMQSLAKVHPRLIYPYNFTDKIYRLIKACDIVVGKAGPNLMWETILLGKPILATGFPLGQEFGNYRFITQAKLGLVSYEPEQTVNHLLRIVKNPRLLNRFRPAIKKQQLFLRQTPPKILAALHPFLLVKKT